MTVRDLVPGSRMHVSALASRLLALSFGLAGMSATLPAEAVIRVTPVTWLGNRAWKIDGAANGTFYFESGRDRWRCAVEAAAVQNPSRDVALKDELQWRHHAVRLLAPGLAQSVDDASVGKHA